MAARKRGAAAVLSTGDEGCGRTFSDLDAESDLIAGRLAGLAPGAVVGLQAPNVPPWPAMLLAIWKAGGCALLLDHTMGEGGRDAMEKVCGACWRLEIAGGEIREVPLGHPAVDFGVEAPDLIKLTSGTSGTPRAILFTAAQLDADCDHICKTMGIDERDVNYGVVAFSHSYGFSNLITPLLCRGIPLAAARDALPRALLAGISASGATVLPAVPAVFQALSGVEGVVPGLRLCISAGAPLPVQTARAFRERFGLKVHTFYGASECGGIAYDASDADVGAPGFVGRSMSGVQIEPLEKGDFLVRSAAAGVRYFPESAGELGGGIFKPADLLEATPEGWRITGRRTDVINVGGKKTSPLEIEEVLLSHPAVREAVVFGLGSDIRTEAVCACVVAEDGVDVSELRAWCAARLAPWQVPRSMVCLDAIPVNARGKVSRVELAKRFAGLL